jgi:hypothetical protein
MLIHPGQSAATVEKPRCSRERLLAPRVLPGDFPAQVFQRRDFQMDRRDRKLLERQIGNITAARPNEGLTNLPVLQARFANRSAQRGCRAGSIPPARS